jgi:hypothetical protein
MRPSLSGKENEIARENENDLAKAVAVKIILAKRRWGPHNGVFWKRPMQI